MKIFFILLLSLNCFAIKSVRSEINRFRLLKDRSIIERNLLTPAHSSFIQLDLNISSGLKSFIGDIDSATGEDDESQKTLGINEVLAQNINTERYLSGFAELGAPLPYLKFEKVSILPSLFLNYFIGASLSTNNLKEATSPETKVYLQKETNYGLSSKIRADSYRDFIFGVDLYQRTRSDISETKDAGDIAAQDDVVVLDELEIDQVDYLTNLTLKKKQGPEEINFEIRELKIFEKEDVKNKIGNAPLIHFNYQKKYFLTKIKLRSLFGIFHRQKYSLADGLYAGLFISFTQENPLEFFFKIDNQFIGYHATIAFKHFKFQYGLKTPYQNPIDDMWVSGVHHIQLGIPF